MIRDPINSLAYLVLAVSAVSLLGCASQATYERDYYILEAVREAAPAAVSTQGTLEVRRFSVDAAFAGEGLVYRRDEFRYESDYYHQFLIAPGIMVTEKTRDWLADAGLFERVLPTGTRLEPTYTLEGNVRALYGDFSGKATPTAVMEIRFFLLTNANGQETVLFAETYRAATRVPSRTADAFVGALNQSLMEILTRLETDLRKALPGKPETAGTEGRK